MSKQKKSQLASPHKTALITGASLGIGADLAKEAAAAQYDVVLVARSENKLQALAQEIEATYGVKAYVIPHDLGQPQAAQNLFDKVEALGLHVDLLVNNAGSGQWGRFLDLNAETDQLMLQLNMITLTDMCRVFGRPMVKKGAGRIVNLASTAAFLPGPMMSTYYASKAYVLSLSEALANEFAEHGVTVTAICPGPTSSGFQEAAAMQKSKLMKLGFMTSKAVARKGFRGAVAGRSVVVTGLSNKLSVLSVRFFPRWLVTRISRAVTAAA